MKKKWMAALLALSMVFGSTSVSAAVKEEKTVKDASGELAFTGRNGVMYREKGEEKVFCDGDGKEFPDLAFRDAELLTGDAWLLKRQGAEVPENCVVKTDGTVLIPWGMNVIKAENEHFLEVIEGDQQTDNKDEAVMYISANMFTLGFPGDEDVLYTGTIRLYDLDGEKMLEDYVLTSTSQSFTPAGTSYKVNDKTSAPKVVDASGKVLAEDASRINAVGNYYYEFRDGSMVVYDDTMTQVAENETANGLVSGGYLSFSTEDNEHGLMALDGTVMIEPVSYSTINPMGGGLFRISKKNEAGDILYGVVDGTGKTVLETKYYAISELKEGYFYAQETRDSETVSLLAPDGHVISDAVEKYPDSNLCEEIGEKQYLILDTGKTLDLSGRESFSAIGTGLITCRDGNTRLFGAYDLKDGSQILDFEWEEIHSAYDRIYALKEGVWHVFTV